MTGKTTDFTLATRANIPTTSEKGCLVHVGKADGTDGYSLGVGDTTFDDVGNNLIFEACPNQWTVLGPIGGTGWKHLAAIVDGAGDVFGFVDGAPASVFHADTTAWEAAVVTAGGSVSGDRKDAVNALIVGLNADGIWSKLDRLWLFAAENSQSALIDIKAQEQATATNSPTFTGERGYSGNQFDQYIFTPFNPSIASSPNYVRDSACIFGWNDIAGTNLGPLFGTSAGLQGRLYLKYTADNNTYWTINDSTGNFSTPAAAGSLGLWANNRSGASAVQLYYNGSSVATASTTSEAISFWTLCGLSELSQAASSYRISCLGIGASLNSTEHGNLYTRLRTYMNDTDVP